MLWEEPFYLSNDSLLLGEWDYKVSCKKLHKHQRYWHLYFFKFLPQDPVLSAIQKFPPTSPPLDWIPCDLRNETAKFRANCFINTRDINITSFGFLSPKHPLWCYEKSSSTFQMTLYSHGNEIIKFHVNNFINTRDIYNFLSSYPKTKSWVQCKIFPPTSPTIYYMWFDEWDC